MHKNTSGLVGSPLSASNSYPLSPQQMRLWRAADDDGGVYSSFATVEWRGPLDRAALAGAIADVVERHEILRTVFPVHFGSSGPVQQVSPTPPRLRPEAAEDALESWSLSVGPLITAVVRQQGALHHALHLRAPAMCTDHDGLIALAKSVVAQYLSTDGSESSGLQYGDITAWLHELLSTTETATARATWARRAAPLRRSLAIANPESTYNRAAIPPCPP